MGVILPVPKPKPEPKPCLSIAEIHLYYEVPSSSGVFELDKPIVENHFNIIVQKISAKLTNELGGECFIGNIEYFEGSIKVSGKVLAAFVFITPIIQGYIVNTLPPLPSPDAIFGYTQDTKEVAEIKYSRVCKTVETITTKTIEEVEIDSELKSIKTTIETKEIKNVYEQWVSTQQP